MVSMNTLTITGWVMTGASTLFSLLHISLGYGSDWVSDMMLVTMITGVLCWIMRSVVALNNKEIINISLLKDHHLPVAIGILIAGGLNWVFALCAAARTMDLSFVLTDMYGNLSWFKGNLAAQGFFAFSAFGAATANCIIAILEIKKIKQVGQA